MRRVLAAVAVLVTACAPSEPASAPSEPASVPPEPATSAPSAATAGYAARASIPPPPRSASEPRKLEIAPTPNPPAPNQNPKDDPAACIDPQLTAAQRWEEKQVGELDRALAKSTSCHLKALKRNAALDGTLTLVLIYTKGQAKPAVQVVGSSIADCELATCVQRLAAKAQVHTTPPDATVTYTLEFRTGRPPTRAPEHAPFGGEHCRTEALAGRRTQVSGRLPPKVIQDVVRGEYGKFRACYERGLARDPTLTGRITVHFVINRDGSVSDPRVYHNLLPDCDVARCLTRAYRELRFPKPEGGGIVTVVYPIVFAPG